MNMYELNNLDYFILLRLVAAVILGGLIGLERSGGNHEAGLRTHIILCLGAASVMVISETLVKQYGGGDIMRMGAQVISGVGFLGVGSIIIDGNRIRGITTAAGLWTTACVGLAVGSGYYIIASVVVALMLFAMFGLRLLKRKAYPKSLRYSVRIDLSQSDAIKKVLKRLTDDDVQIYSFRLEEDSDESYAVMDIKLRKGVDIAGLIGEIAAFDGVKEFLVI